MTEEVQEQQAQEAHKSDKELNFRALEAKFQNELEKQKKENEEMARKLEELSQKENEDDDDYDDYVNSKRLKKEIERLKKDSSKQTQEAVQQSINQALKKERQELWFKQHQDFQDIMKHADKFAEQYPEMAEDILHMPQGFERQKLVYDAIKAHKLHEPKEDKPSTQDMINQNRRVPYYQGGGVGSSPHAMQGDFSSEGKKNAYAKMQELKSRLRLG